MAEIDDLKFGLVLSGGGAKGAYEVGVVKALCEMDIQIGMISGASIGALNGAVLATAPDLATGVNRLISIWNCLSSDSPVKFDIGAFTWLWTSFGLAFTVPIQIMQQAVIALVTQKLFYGEEKGICCSSPLVRLLNEYVDLNKISKDLPLYISLYKSEHALLDLLGYITAKTGFFDNSESQYVNIESLPTEERKSAIMGSAALPFLYKRQKINGSMYADGGLGNAFKSKGNTPAEPLVKAGCSHIIVVHLANGSFWDRAEYPNVAIAEIRPKFSFERSPERGLLNFSRSHISDLIKHGYQDTISQIGDLANTFCSVNIRKRSEMRSFDMLDEMCENIVKLNSHPLLNKQHKGKLKN